MNFFKGLGKKITQEMRGREFDLQEIWDKAMRINHPLFTFYLLLVDLDKVRELGVNPYGTINPFLEDWSFWNWSLWNDEEVSHKDYNGEKKWFPIKVGKE